MAKVIKSDLFNGYKEVVLKRTKWSGKKVVVVRLTENVKFQSLETVRTQ